MCHVFLDWERFAAPRGIEYLSPDASNKKPPALVSQEASFGRRHEPEMRRGAAEDQLRRLLEMISPNNSHLSPLKRIKRSCLIGAKSVGDVLMVMPGSNVSGA